MSTPVDPFPWWHDPLDLAEAEPQTRLCPCGQRALQHGAMLCEECRDDTGFLTP